MKNLFSVLLLLVFVAVGCSDEQVTEKPVPGRDSGNVITFQATMPAKASTRLVLGQDELDVTLQWEEGDQVHLYLVYGNEVETQIADIKHISADGKSGQFQVVLPEGDYTEFDLYGVYGGGGLSAIDKSKALLPSFASTTAGELTDLGDVVMLTFGYEKISRENPSMTIQFEHIGSLFSIKLNNNSSSNWANISEVRLVSHKPIGAHFSSVESYYDLVTGEFSGTIINSNEFSFALSEPVTIPAGQSTSFWAWFIPAENKNWPSLKLQVMDESNNELAVTTISQPSKPDPTPAGQAFYINANWNGTLLTHTVRGSDARITFTTMRAIGETLRLNVQRSGTGFVWLDLNNNGYRNDGEEITSFNAPVEYKAGAKTMTLYGNLTHAQFVGAGPTQGLGYKCDIRHIDLSNAFGLTNLDIRNNYLTEIDFTGVENTLELLTMSYSYNLGEIDLTPLMAMTYFNGSYSNDKPWTSVIAPSTDVFYRMALMSSKMSKETMTDVIAHLPDRTGLSKGELRILENVAARSSMQNEVTTDHFTAASAKNWEIQILEGSSYKAATPGNYGPDYGPHIP